MSSQRLFFAASDKVTWRNLDAATFEAAREEAVQKWSEHVRYWVDLNLAGYATEADRETARTTFLTVRPVEFCRVLAYNEPKEAK